MLHTQEFIGLNNHEFLATLHVNELQNRNGVLYILLDFIAKTSFTFQPLIIWIDLVVP